MSVRVVNGLTMGMPYSLAYWAAMAKVRLKKGPTIKSTWLISSRSSIMERNLVSLSVMSFTMMLRCTLSSLNSSSAICAPAQKPISWKELIDLIS